MATQCKILITGSAGFLGSALFKNLSDQGYQVTGIDIQPSLEGTVSYLYDARNIDEITVDYDVVFHFAAFVGGRLSIETEYFGIAANNEIDRKVFEFCVKRGVRHLVYPSSSAVYPIDMQTKDFNIDLDEDLVDFSTNTFGMPDHLYGWNKLTAERLLWQTHIDQRIPCISVLRPFSVYGPAQSMDYPFNALMKRVADSDPNHLAITVWGDGKHSRDFVYIDDALDVFNYVIKNPESYRVLNIATGTPTTFVSLMNTMSEIIHGNPLEQAIPMMDKPIGVYSRYGSIEKLKQLGLAPKISVREGVERIVKNSF